VDEHCEWGRAVLWGVVVAAAAAAAAAAAGGWWWSFSKSLLRTWLRERLMRRLRLVRLRSRSGFKDEDDVDRKTGNDNGWESSVETGGGREEEEEGIVSVVIDDDDDDDPRKTGEKRKRRGNREWCGVLSDISSSLFFENKERTRRISSPRSISSDSWCLLLVARGKQIDRT
jgi:hypothetical protein